MGNRKSRGKNIDKLKVSIMSDINELYECTEVPIEKTQEHLQAIGKEGEGLIAGIAMELKHNEYKK